MKTIIKNDRKWEVKEISENRFEVKYYEYSNICKCWTYISKGYYCKELVGELEII